MSKKSKLNVSVMFAFGRGCGMPLSGTAVSPYSQVSERLQNLGHPRLAGESVKSHCLRMMEVIKATANGFRKSPNKVSRPDAVIHTIPHGVDVKTDAFLSTYEWRKVRMMALKKYGAICQCCGASPRTGAVMNVDHIKPRKLFPHLALDLDNLQVLCHECNHGKGNWDMTDWRDPEDDPESIRILKSF